MDWSEWYKQYDQSPGLLARLRLVRQQIAAVVEACPAGPVRIVSVCAGDGRDVIGALADHPRRHDVSAALLDNHAESIARGRAAAQAAGLGERIRLIEADATLARNYQGHVPADLVLLSGFLGHLRHEDVPGLIGCVPMLCRTGGWVIWNRHLVLHKGSEQVPAIRGLFREHDFEEVFFEAPIADGFAVGRVRFKGQSRPLEPDRVIFEFVGLDRLLTATLPATAEPGVPVSESRPAGDTTKLQPTAGEDGAELVEQSIPALFAQVAARHGSRLALGSGAWQPTYAELNSAANRFAHQLIARGGATGGRAAMLMSHDTPLFAATLGALKAGQGIVVLNSTDPPTRLAEVLDDAQPGFIITDRANHALAARLAQPAHCVLCFEETASGPDRNPTLDIAPDALAFLLYTSGSTGRPKGVVQTHRNIIHNVFRLTRGMELGAADRIVLLASLSGGQGLATTWCALLNGAALCPFAAVERGVVGLAEWLNERRITVFVSSASVFRHFLGTLDAAARLPSVRLVRLASEPATTADFEAFQKHFPDNCILFSTLSSSETGNITQHRLNKRDAPAPGRLPVGWAAAGMELRLVDEQGLEVRAGDIGEIVVRSRYLSPGYWRNEALTAKRFVAVAGADGLREFRSGDRGRRLPDGALLFMGRSDNQVKIHGYRVELSEVEEALARQPGVEGAVVCARTGVNNAVQLIAYVVARNGQPRDAEPLRRELRRSLPGYMVPAAFVFLTQFPLTPHGKIDRNALPSPPGPAARSQAALKPRDVVERSVARIFESVLGLPSVGRRDDFFDLGGTSLQSVEVVAAIEETFNVALSPAALIEHSTVEKLAPLLAEHAVIPSRRPLVTLREDGGGRPLFLIHSGQGDVVTYGLLVRKLRARPVYGLQAVGVQGESWPLMDIPAMAERYLPEILEKDPTGPYLLAGTCMGGMVAFELAQRLVRLGRTVGLLALMDVPASPWSGRRPLWHEALLDPLRDALRRLCWAGVWAGATKPTSRQLPAYRRFVAGMTGRANRRYRPAFYPGVLTLLLTAETDFPHGDRRKVMAQHARETRTLMLSGSRPELFVRPSVDELARQLQVCLDQADGNG